MAIVRWSPILDSFEYMNHMFDDFLPAPRGGLHGFVPSVDVYQDKENIIIDATLPGVDPDGVSVSIENDVLTIEGKSEKKTEVDEQNYYRKEVRYGSFHRAVALPVAVDGSAAKASFKNGILKVVIPKEERAKPKQVEIQVDKDNK